MIDTKAPKQPQSKIVVGPKSSPGKLAMMPDTVPSQDRIRGRAYELYESRGREPGQDEQDWLRAEQEFLKRQQ
jgi:hypothetical protein